jgi:hypothetical protein
VRLTDATVATAWPALETLGLAPDASRSRPRLTTDLEQALGPEREASKLKLFADSERLANRTRSSANT